MASQSCAYCGNWLLDLATTVPASPPTPAPDDLAPEYRDLECPWPPPTRKTSKTFLWIGLLWTFCLSPVFALMMGTVHWFDDSATLARQPVAASATITHLSVEAGGDSTGYEVYYRYVAPQYGFATTFDGYDTVSAAYYADLHLGQAIEIVYAAQRPRISAVAAEFTPPSLWSRLAPLGGALAFALGGLVMLLFGMEGALKRLWLRLSGRRADGLVFGRWEAKDAHGAPKYFISYAFKLDSGRIVLHTNEGEHIFDKYHIGDCIALQYLPNDSKICVPHT